MFVKLFAATLFGIDAKVIETEVDTSPGLPALNIVGLADISIRESRERIRGCLRNSGFEYPLCRITVNLSPANILKYGTQFDLSIALGILMSSNQIPANTQQAAFLGELSLDGKIKGVRGILAMVAAAKEAGILHVFVPKENAAEAGMVGSLKIYCADNFKELVEALRKGQWERLLIKEALLARKTTSSDNDFSNISGQDFAKRGLEIAAAGSHNILLCGPPGSGKSMLAAALSTILPELSQDEILEAVKVRSAAGEPLFLERPFRSPHHAISLPAFIGGGWVLRPGEISLAHKGVLFMDEFAEFPRAILESLRQPLENQKVAISRLNNRFTFPADFILVAAQNPCPCGWYGSGLEKCKCTASQINSYQRKISGPILDRIDIRINLKPLNLFLFAKTNAESSADIRKRTDTAAIMQKERQGCYNGRASNNISEEFFNYSKEAHQKLISGCEKLKLSARSYVRLRRVCRTIADLSKSESVLVEHVQEGLQYKAADLF